MELLRVENLSMLYSVKDNIVKAIDNISFSIDRGQFVAIMGPSGSGKSTLLHILGGLSRPTLGKVYLDNEDIYQQNEDQLAIFRRREVGLIYQFYNLIPVLNVYENIILPIVLDYKKINQNKINEIIEFLKLKDRIYYLPNQLSGGQKQRVSIARALINDPALILADEPTGNLDSQNSQQIIELLKLSNKRYNQTIIMITHDENIARQADRIIEIEDGKIVKDEVVR